MASIITLEGIDQAISGLSYKKGSIKYRLVHRIRSLYTDDRSMDSTGGIDTDELVKILWDTGDIPEKIQNRRKNLNSVKSSINADLNKRYEKGENPQGITIGPENVFVMSEKAKDKVLKEYGYDLKPDGILSLKQIMEILNMAKERLSDSMVIEEEVKASGSSGLAQLKDLIRELSENIDLIGGDTERIEDDEVLENIEDVEIDEDSEIEGVEDIEDDEALETVSDVEVNECLEDIEDVEVDEDSEIDEVEDIEDDEALETVSDVEVNECLEDVEDVEIDEDSEIDETTDIEEDEFPETMNEIEENEFLEDTEDIEIDEDSEVEEVEDIEDYEALEMVDEIEEDETLGDVEDVEIDAETEIDEVDTDDLVEMIEDESGVDEIDDTDDQNKFSDGTGKYEKTTETQKIGLPTGSLGQEIPIEENEKIEKARLLAEEFDGYLGVIDRYFNHYMLIPEGEYIVGSKVPMKEERAEQVVSLQSFYFGRFPVTNGLFEIFVEKTGYKTTAEKIGYGNVYYGRIERKKDETTGLITSTWNASLYCESLKGAYWYQPSGPGSNLHNKRNHPVVQISLEDAMAFAAWTGKRLPTEDEWEAAARTANAWEFPWGSEWKRDSCNVEESCIGDTTSVGKYAQMENEFGIIDTLGNVLEWTMDSYDLKSKEEDGSEYRIAKGGSWVSGNDIKLFSRFILHPNLTSNILGFRCVAY